jgi:serpin B
MSDLNGMSDSPEFFLASLKQRAGIEVNEEGTEAWVVTSGEFVEMGMPPPPPPVKVFRADHPFLYLIQTVEGDLLFMGRLKSPIASD